MEDWKELSEGEEADVRRRGEGIEIGQKYARQPWRIFCRRIFLAVGTYFLVSAHNCFVEGAADGNARTESGGVSTSITSTGEGALRS